jgi:hypothetical protein
MARSSREEWKGLEVPLDLQSLLHCQAPCSITQNPHPLACLLEHSAYITILAHLLATATRHIAHSIRTLGDSAYITILAHSLYLPHCHHLIAQNMRTLRSGRPIFSLLCPLNMIPVHLTLTPVNLMNFADTLQTLHAASLDQR